MKRYPTMALICLTAGCLFTLVGCDKQESPQTVSAPPPDASTPVPTGARLATPQEVALVPDGTQLISPESGKLIQKSPSTPALVYDGRMYFLCCPTTMQRCKANPRLLQDAKSPNGYDLRKLMGSGS